MTMKNFALNTVFLLFAPGVLGQPGASADEDPFEFLLDESNTVLFDEVAAEPLRQAPVAAPKAAPRPTASEVQAEPDPFVFLRDPQYDPYSAVARRAGRNAGNRGEVDFTLQYVSDDSFTFGRYNGLHQQGVVPLLDAYFRSWLPAAEGEQPRYWQLRLEDVGSDVGEAELRFGKRDTYRLAVAVDQLLQVNNDSGETPFKGDSRQVLPSDWVASNTTGGMTALESSSKTFRQKLERNRYSLAYMQRLSRQWSLDLELRSEEKEGQATVGAAFYVDAASALSTVLKLPVDQTTNELDFQIHYSGEKLQFNGSYLYSRFDNHAETLQWQNPYNGNFGAGTDYPEGFGQISTEPDTQLHRFSAQASYPFRPDVRVYGDVSYSLASQDENFLDYTINPTLVVTEPLPRTSLDGEIGTTVANAGLQLRPLRKLSVDFRYTYYDRDNDSPRDGYLYPRGDSADQPASLRTIYNRPFEMTRHTFKARAGYRLPKRMRLSVNYQFENISRYNAAVEETDESKVEAVLRFAPADNLSGRVSFGFSDRAASTYNWDQSYYALLDTQLINLTPDNQRYNNHPALSQFHLANREVMEAKFNLGYTPGTHWSHNLDFLWDNRDYDQTELGLGREEHLNLTLSSSYQAGDHLAFSAYYSYDNYQAEQKGRAFRGGAEKNAFATEPPLPQASDPARNWVTEPDNDSHALGANASWTIRPGLVDTVLDYSFVDTSLDQRFRTFGAGDISGASVPNDGSRMHHLQWDANYYYSDDLSFTFSYQFYRFNEDRWAYDGIAANTLGSVLGTGQRTANDKLHMVGVSVQLQMP